MAIQMHTQFDFVAFGRSMSNFWIIIEIHEKKEQTKVRNTDSREEGRQGREGRERQIGGGDRKEERQTNRQAGRDNLIRTDRQVRRNMRFADRK